MANDFSDSDFKALWSLESGAITVDSKGSNTLSNYNSVSADTVNYKEKSASGLFDRSGSTMLYITNANLDAGFPLKSGDTNKTITLCFWVRPNLGGSTGGIWGFDVTNKYSLLVYINTDSKLVISCGYNNGSSIESFVHGSALTNDGSVWYHVGIVIDGVNKTIFVKIQDEALSKVGSNIDTVLANELNVEDSNLYIGRQINQYYNGNLDEIVVSAALKNETQIDQIAADTYGGGGGTTYNQSVAGVMPNPVGVLVKVTNKILSGSVPFPFGANTVKTSKRVAGSSPNPTGTLGTTNLLIQGVAGDMPNPTGSLIKTARKVLSGIMPSSSGTNVLKTSKYVAGDMPNPVGSVIKKATRFVAGIFSSPSGSVSPSFTVKQSNSGDMPSPSGVVSGIIKKISSFIGSVFDFLFRFK